MSDPLTAYRDDLARQSAILTRKRTVLAHIELAMENLTHAGVTVQLTLPTPGQADLRLVIPRFDEGGHPEPDPTVVAEFIADYGLAASEAAGLVSEDWTTSDDDPVPVVADLLETDTEIPAGPPAEAAPETPADQVIAADQGEATLAVDPGEGPEGEVDPAPAVSPEAGGGTSSHPSDRYAGLIPAKDPLTDDDRAVILRMAKDGLGTGDIAAKLRRDPRGFYHIVRRVLEEADAVAAPVEVPKPVPASAVPDPVVHTPSGVPAVKAGALQETINPPDAPPVGASAKGTDAAIAARLDKIGNKGKWSDPQDDLYLVKGLTKGLKLAQIALDLSIDADVCAFRFQSLVPVAGLEEQTAVIRVLEQRIAAAARRK